eukprot:scaffold133237_cov41-Attheya_sp.AAC.2
MSRIPKTSDKQEKYWDFSVSVLEHENGWSKVGETIPRKKIIKIKPSSCCTGYTSRNSISSVINPNLSLFAKRHL